MNIASRVFTSIDSGTTWAQTASVPNNDLGMGYIPVEATNPAIVYVASFTEAVGVPVNISKNDGQN